MKATSSDTTGEALGVPLSFNHSLHTFHLSPHSPLADCAWPQGPALTALGSIDQHSGNFRAQSPKARPTSNKTATEKVPGNLDQLFIETKKDLKKKRCAVYCVP